MSWRCHEAVGADGTVHVWPEDDEYEHDLDGICLCGPSVEEYSNGAKLVTHNSLDGREQEE